MSKPKSTMDTVREEQNEKALEMAEKGVPLVGVPRPQKALLMRGNPLTDNPQHWKAHAETKRCGDYGCVAKVGK